MKPKDLLQCSKHPFTSPYAEPDKASPYHSILLQSILISSHLYI